jgi:hypothetical protein
METTKRWKEIFLLDAATLFFTRELEEPLRVYFWFFVVLDSGSKNQTKAI